MYDGKNKLLVQGRNVDIKSARIPYPIGNVKDMIVSQHVYCIILTC